MPSPAQKRILKAMVEYPGLRVAYWNYQTVWSTVYATGGARERDIVSQYGKPRGSTVRVLLSEGYIEPEEEGSPFHVLTDKGREEAEGYTEDELKSVRQGMKASYVIQQLIAERHSDESQWIAVRELRMGTGWKDWRADINVEQRIDLWCMHCWPSKDYLKVAYEVKVSRQDFKREIDNPEKRESYKLVADEFYFAMPAGLVSLEEVPEDAGLVEVHSDGLVQVVRKAPYEKAISPEWGFVASLARSLR